MENLRHPLGHRRLSRPWPTGEGHMQARGRAGELHLLPGLVHQQQGSDFTDPGFDGAQADQLTVELIQHISHTRRGIGSGQINRGHHTSLAR